jgi:hypothetical protein
MTVVTVGSFHLLPGESDFQPGPAPTTVTTTPAPAATTVTTTPAPTAPPAAPASPCGTVAPAPRLYDAKAAVLAQQAAAAQKEHPLAFQAVKHGR